LFGHQLRRAAGGADNLRALFRHELDVVNHGAFGDIGKRKGVSNFDVRLGSGVNGVADIQAVRINDVPLLAVGVVNESDASGAVWIVFDRGNLSGHAPFVPFEIDNAVAPVMPSADVADHDLAGVVASSRLGERAEK